MSEPQSVTIQFKVADERRAASPSIVSSTDACFIEAAIAAIRTSVFTAVADHPNPAIVYEETILFQPGASGLADKDALESIIFVNRPQPSYPRNCYFLTKGLEVVFLRYDISADGFVENARIVDSTTACLERPTLRTVQTWRAAATDGGPITPRKDVDLEVAFVSDRNFGNSKPRETVTKRLDAVVSAMEGEDRSAEELLSDLDDLENEYGGSFSFIETTSFYLVRAYVRLAVGDDARAYDDILFGVRNDAYLPIKPPDMSKDWPRLYRAFSDRAGSTVIEGELRVSDERDRGEQ